MCKVVTDSNVQYSEWSDWNPREYLDTYFHDLGTDSYAAWNFLIKELRTFKKPITKVLDFGAGPTLFGAIPLCPYVQEIHLAEYLQQNLDELEKWINNEESFSWKGCIGHVLRLEGRKVDDLSIEDREDELRTKITKLIKCDASRSPSISSAEKYPLLVATYCLDSATSSKEIWNQYMHNMLELVEPKGIVLITALRECKQYKVGKYNYPSANINEQDLEKVFLDNGFSSKIETCDAPDCIEDGFSGLMFARAQKQ